jgi:hypothetical protein
MSEQSNSAAERSAHVTRGEATSPATWPAVQLPDGTWQLRRIAELEATVATIQAERNHLIGVLQIAVEQNGDTEHPPAWVDDACRILNRGFLKVDRAALKGGKKDE